MEKKKKNNTPLKGFTLVEVLVSALLILIGVATLTALISSARFFLKQTENKAGALGVATVRMEECLATSYDGLVPGVTSGTENNINWQVTITDRAEGNPALHVTPRQIRIPYRHIQVVAAYNEIDASGNTEAKTIELENVVPYPFLHAYSFTYPPPAPGAVAVLFGSGVSPFHPIGNGLRLTFTTLVPKNFLVIYNVSVGIGAATAIPLAPTHLILTGCFVYNAAGHLIGGPMPVVTGTPIISQPLISNAVGLEGTVGGVNFPLQPGTYTIEIRWYKDTQAGNIFLREANLMIIASEG